MSAVKYEVVELISPRHHALEFADGPHIVLRSRDEEPGRDEVLRSITGKRVTRELLPRELIKPFAAIEGADDVVAVEPKVPANAIALEAVALRVSHNVEPVPPPALAVAWARQEPIDQPLVRVWPLVQRKHTNLVVSR